MQDNLHSPVEQQLSETCKFIGIPKVDAYMVDNVTKMQPEDLAQHLDAVTKLCKNCA